MAYFLCRTESYAAPKTPTADMEVEKLRDLVALWA
jgi:hypothetical protein